MQDTFETTVAVATDPTTNNTDIASLNQKVKSMMMSSDNPDRPPRICKVCGIEESWNTMRNHIEANHITGISIPCDLCGKSFKSRNCLSAHKSQQHRKIKGSNPEPKLIFFTSIQSTSSININTNIINPLT